MLVEKTERRSQHIAGRVSALVGVEQLLEQLVVMPPQGKPPTARVTFLQHGGQWHWLVAMSDGAQGSGRAPTRQAAAAQATEFVGTAELLDPSVMREMAASGRLYTGIGD